MSQTKRWEIAVTLGKWLALRFRIRYGAQIQFGGNLEQILIQHRRRMLYLAIGIETQFFDEVGPVK